MRRGERGGAPRRDGGARAHDADFKLSRLWRHVGRAGAGLILIIVLGEFVDTEERTKADIPRC